MPMTPPDSMADIIRQIFSYFWYIAMGLFGATISYFSKVRAGRKFRLTHLLFEWGTAAFVAVCTALVCSWQNISEDLTYALCGISGHMGGRAIALFENFVLSKVNIKTGE